jgi:O-antigen/teichoic acid export membrane protein
MPSFKRKTLANLAWSTTGTFSVAVLQFLIGVVLARILDPGDFGLIGMILVFSGFAQLLGSMGFTEALIQRKELRRAHSDSAFWITLALGATMALLLWHSAISIAGFYDEPLLEDLLRVVSITFVIRSFALVQDAMMRRTGHFRTLAAVETIASLIAGLLAIALALSGFGVWSLAWQNVAQACLTAALLWRSNHWRPHCAISVRATRDLAGFSLNLFGFSAFNYWIRNADNLLVGKYIGPEALGQYSRAYSLMLLPITHFNRAMGRAMFPALSAIQDDRERVKRIYLKANRLIALVTVPTMAGLLVVAEPLVLLLYGPKWQPMIPILQVLCLVAIKQPMDQTTGWIFQSQGRTDIMFRWGVFAGVANLLFIVVGLQWGVFGIAVAYTARVYVTWFWLISIPGRLVGLTFPEYFVNLRPIFASGLAMASALYVLDHCCVAHLAQHERLLLLVFVGPVLYIGFLALTNPGVFRELIDLVVSSRDPAHPAQ